MHLYALSYTPWLVASFNNDDAICKSGFKYITPQFHPGTQIYKPIRQDSIRIDVIYTTYTWFEYEAKQ